MKKIYQKYIKYERTYEWQDGKKLTFFNKYFPILTNNKFSFLTKKK